MKEYNIGYEDGIKIAAQVLGEKFGNYLTHMIEFDNTDHFVKFASELSFTKGTNHSNLWFPDNIHIFEFNLNDGCNILFGGQPTASQNYEILCLCDKLNVKRESMLIAEENTQVYNDFLVSVEKWKESKSSASLTSTPLVKVPCKNCGTFILPTTAEKNNGFCMKCNKNANQNKKGCYIATVCYGDCNAPQVLAFKQYRDNFLMKRKFGQNIIKIYYKVSPYLANKLKKHIILNHMVRKLILDPIYNYYIIKKQKLNEQKLKPTKR